MTTPNLNQLAPISDFDNAYVLAQQAHEQGFRGSTFADLYLWLKTKLDVLGLSNTAGLPEEFPQDGDILSAADAGQWTILGPGIYHQPGYPSIEVAEGTVVFAQFDGTQFSVQREVEMPVPEGVDVINPEGEGLPKEKAVAGYAVSKKSLKYSSIVQPDSTFIKLNTVVTTIGSVNTNPTEYAGAVSIVDFPLEPNTTYTLGGFNASVDKNFALSDGSESVSQVSTLATLPKTFTTGDTYTFLRAAIKQIDSQEPSSTWAETLMLNKGVTLQEVGVVEIDGRKVTAKSLTVDNVVPNPISDKNAVNLQHFNVHAVKDEDLGIERTLNLANQNDIITGRYIGNTGTIATGEGWKMIAIDVSNIPDGSPITFGRFTIDVGGYSAFHSSSGLVQNNGSYATSSLPKTYIKPSDATVLYIDISRPTGVNEYSQITVNVGVELIDFVPYGLIKSIKGIPLGAGTSNVSKFSDLEDVPNYLGNSGKALKVNSAADGLDTFNPVEEGGDVEFRTVVASAVIISNIPIWDETGTPPIQIGDDYNFPDSNGHYFRKTRGV